MPETDESEPTKVPITEGVPVVWNGDDGLETARVSEIDGEFVRVGGLGNAHWLRLDDIMAVGVYGDEPGLEWKVESREGR